MYERFTDRARMVLRLAYEEAQRFDHEYIGTEHILLGLAKDRCGVAADVLSRFDVGLSAVRRKVENLVQGGPDVAPKGESPQTPRAKRAIQCAIEESRNLNHNYVGTEHLLLGVMRVEDGMGAQVLISLGLAPEEVRRAVFNLLGCEVDR